MNEDRMEKAFIDAFDTYGDAIFRFAMVKVSNVELAEDMTQEVFTRFWQALRDGKEMHNTRAYLYTVANNLAKDWYKKKKSESLDARMEAGHEPADTKRANAEIEASYKEVLDAIEGMEPTDREVLLLRHVEGLDPKDIAEILGESPNVISVRLNRATKRLRTYLETGHG